MKNIDGKTAIITGASSGIGEATAHKLAENQASVVLASRSREKLEGIADEIEQKHGAETQVIPTDVTDEKEIENLFKKTQEEFGEIDIVVSNAGLAMSGEVIDSTTASGSEITETQDAWSRYQIPTNTLQPGEYTVEFQARAINKGATGEAETSFIIN